VKFLVDACVPKQVADWLRSQSHDVSETTALGPDPGDRAVLDLAEREQRVLVTMDKDFGLLIFREGRGHAGLARLPHAVPRRCVALMRDVLSAYGDELSGGAVVKDQENRIRVSGP
jgi:predicted nuclease of predicted toxin-antitoxin system